MVGWLYEDFPEPYRSMGANALHMPERKFVFLKDDELAYEKLLQSAFPGLIYEEEWTKQERHGVEKPLPRTRRTLNAFRQSYVFFHFDGGKAPVRVVRDGIVGWHAIRKAWPYARWSRQTDINDWAPGLPKGQAPPQSRCERCFPGMPEVDFGRATDGGKGLAPDRQGWNKELLHG